MKISVLIFAYNRKEFLLYAVNSVLMQTLDRSKYEIIVIKNFTDNEIDSFLSQNDLKMILSYGTIGNYIIAGITQATGNIICFLDDDDLFTKNKLEIVFNLFTENKSLCYYHNNFDAITKSGNHIKIRNRAPDFNMSCISINLDNINISRAKHITASPDTFVYLMALDSGNKIICGKEKLTEYRVHNSTSSSYVSNFNEFNIKNQKYITQILDNFNIFLKIVQDRKTRNYLYAQITNWSISLYTYNMENEPSKIINFLIYDKIGFSNKASKLLLYLIIKLHLKGFILYVQKMRYNRQLRI